MDGPVERRVSGFTSRTSSGTTPRIPAATARSSSSFGTTPSHSDVLVQTSDETWEAYNDWGGNSLYSCTIDCPSGNPLAYKGAASVSYNRPFDGTLTTDNGHSNPYYAEYQLIYWLEENGYDVSYTDEGTVDSTGALLKNHKIFISSGHDEYWSPGQRANVAAALAAGVNLAFFSGNEMFWKTRWGPSIDGSNTPYRTLTTYKETHYNAQVDPQDPPTWTGAWADPRFSPPGDGGQPANAITGQQFLVNSGTLDLTVPSTSTRSCASGGTPRSPSLAAGRSRSPSRRTRAWSATNGTPTRTTDSGRRGRSTCPSTTGSGLQAFTDYGSTLNSSATATHHLTLYRAPSGALVFGAGTVQWSWGLTNVGPGPAGPGSRTIRRTRTCSRRRSTCSPTWALSQRRSSPAYWRRRNRRIRRPRRRRSHRQRPARPFRTTVR